MLSKNHAQLLIIVEKLYFYLFIDRNKEKLLLCGIK